jgi:hypothetical protein
MIKSRNMGSAGYVAHMGEKQNACKVLLGNIGRKEAIRKI